MQVRDLFNRNPGDARHPFRLALRKETPDFRLVALAVQPAKQKDDTRLHCTWTPCLRRGETQVMKILAFRQDGFNGEIQLTAERLPPGISCAGATIPEGRTNALLAFTADNDAAAWGGAVRIIGRAKAADTESGRAVRGGSEVWHMADVNEEPVRARMIHEVALGVSGRESAPITVAPATNKTFEAVAGMKIQIPLKITRRAEFNENLKLKAVGLSALDSLGELEVNGKTNAATLEIDLSKLKLAAGSHSFFLQAQTKGKYRNYADEAKAADEVLKQAEKAAAVAPADTKSAAEEKKIIAQKAAKDLAEKSKPIEATIMVYSAPITILIKPGETK